jgi:hypothetical protein
MELEQDSHLTLPLFLYDHTLNERDIESPDFELTVLLNEELLTQLCQNPSQDSSIAISISGYVLKSINPTLSDVLSQTHSAQLTLNHGPLLSAVLNTDNDSVFVSPQMDMMPTFDLGDEDE